MRSVLDSILLLLGVRKTDFGVSVDGEWVFGDSQEEQIASTTLRRRK